MAEIEAVGDAGGTTDRDLGGFKALIHEVAGDDHGAGEAKGEAIAGEVAAGAKGEDVDLERVGRVLNEGGEFIEGGKTVFGKGGSGVDEGFGVGDDEVAVVDVEVGFEVSEGVHPAELGGEVDDGFGGVDGGGRGRRGEPGAGNQVGGEEGKADGGDDPAALGGRLPGEDGLAGGFGVGLGGGGVGLFALGFGEFIPLLFGIIEDEVAKKEQGGPGTEGGEAEEGDEALLFADAERDLNSEEQADDEAENTGDGEEKGKTLGGGCCHAEVRGNRRCRFRLCTTAARLVEWELRMRGGGVTGWVSMGIREPGHGSCIR